MSTFFLLPSRHFVGRQFAELLSTLFPGLDWPAHTWPDLAEVTASLALTQSDVYVVFREDLPDTGPAEQALVDACGAERGDEVIEVHLGPARRWTVAVVRAAA
jgi:hypothetical protein